jgi:hypothetical protein
MYDTNVISVLLNYTVVILCIIDVSLCWFMASTLEHWQITIV